MTLLWAGAAVLLVTSIAVGLMLLVRRTAPDGGYFHDGDRAAGVFGVLATGFSVLLGFVVFLAFTSFDTARAGAEVEAGVVTQQMETALLFAPATTDVLAGELVCYARSVAGVQWDRMVSGQLGDELNPWAGKLLDTIRGIDPQTPAEQAAFQKWLDQRSEREAARQDRIHGAAGVIPTPLWIVLGFTSLVILVFMLFFADSGERALVQAVLMGSVASVLTTMLLLLLFLNEPFHEDIGGLRPVAMERALRIMDQQLATAGVVVDPPCDEQGVALAR